MKLIKFLFIGLVGLLVLLLVVGMVLPNEYEVTRSTNIEAPPVIVYGQVNDLTKWEAWSPWKERDPGMKITYGDKSIGEGASYSWTGDVSGSGTLTIIGAEMGSRIDTRVEFDGQGEGNGFWTFEPDGNGTKATWGMKGTMPKPMGGFMVGMMDGWLGPDFEQGLAGVKREAEAEAKRKPAVGAALEQAAKELGQEMGKAMEELGKAMGEAGKAMGEAAEATGEAAKATGEAAKAAAGE